MFMKLSKNHRPWALKGKGFGVKVVVTYGKNAFFFLYSTAVGDKSSA